jgi:hypothetical protein
MTPRARARHLPTASLALGAVAALALSGCGTVHAQGADPTGKPTGSTAVPVTSAKSPARPSPTPKQRAEADADSILASFAVPKGARRLSAAPTVEKSVLKTPPQVPGTPDLVDKAEWWIAPGAPQSVLAWEEKHVSHRFSTTTGSGRSWGPDFVTWFQTFTLPDIRGVLDSRLLLVTVAQDGDRTAIRVDGQVTWQPARPAGEKVPAAARAVTIAMKLGFNQDGRKPPKPVTITDRAKVGALKALINGLLPFPPGMFSCPADFADGLVLTFRAGPRAPALAVAAVGLSGCDAVGLTIGGKSQPALAGPGTDTGAAILKTAGLSWKIPSE